MSYASVRINRFFPRITLYFPVVFITPDERISRWVRTDDKMCILLYYLYYYNFIGISALLPDAFTAPLKKQYSL